MIKDDLIDIQPQPYQKDKMSADVPLLNDYKKSFVKRRMIQTFMGGLQVIRNDIPWWIIVPQVILFLFPALLSVPFMILLEYANDLSTSR